MLLAIVAIIFDFIALFNDVYIIYYRVMLIVHGILLGIGIGECYMGNMFIKHGCRFDRKDDDNENSKN
jgi:hypothetical protein